MYDVYVTIMSPYVISHRLLIHMKAVRVIFGQIQGDYIKFTMAAVAAMLIFSAMSKNLF